MSGMRGVNTGGSGINLIPDSPAHPAHVFKRQRNNLDGAYSDTSNSGYNSGADDGDDLFEGVNFTTPPKHVTQPTQILAKHLTQPTQILDRPQNPHPLSSSPMRQGELQVPASSPYRTQDSPTRKRPADNASHLHSQPHSGPLDNNGSQGYKPQPSAALNYNRPQPSPLRPGRLGTSMAPAGTTFKTPHGVVKAITKPKPQPIIFDIDDDDGPRYKGDSSDDEGSAGANIKPTSFGSKAKNTSFDGSRAKMPSFGASNGVSSMSSAFSSIVQGARYDPTKANGLSQASNKPEATLDSPQAPTPVRRVDSMSEAYGGRRPPQQNGPARAQAVPVEMQIEDIQDDSTKRKIQQMLNVLPAQSVSKCYHALLSNKMSVQDAMNSMVAIQEISSDDEIESPDRAAQRVSMKATTNVPIASIRERYGTNPNRQQAQGSIPSQTSPEVKPPKKRLVQGRKHQSSPPPTPAARKPEPVLVEVSDDENDSGVDNEESDVDPGFDGRLLRFLNTSSDSEIADLTMIKLEVAQGFVAARPFKNLVAAEEYSDAPPTKTGKRSTRKPIGAKIVQNANDMLTGYEAVDYIVKKCEMVAQPLTAEMEKWGFDVSGKGKSGELEMTSLGPDADESGKDSGIGTPTSKSSGEEEVRMINGRKVTFLKQPAIMNPEFPAKDYQLVGLNWLNLIFKNRLSCILADDMGLGKTFQVISFISHLVETGVSGPHLVIVPSSVLENWLREFEKFSPQLAVEPYAGSQGERAEIADNILARRGEVNVVVASYDNSKRPDDARFLRHLRATVCVFDEGHALKNPESARYKVLMRVPAQMRILLTGTPLQNNLKELAAILAFILPDIFSSKREELEFIFKHRATTSDSDHSALLSTQRTQRAKSMLTPFVLRRKKEQVMKHLPAKTCRIEYCSLTASQKKIYHGFTSHAAELKRMRAEGIATDEKGENNPIMQLRKAAIHPMLFRRHFTDEKLKKMLPLLKRHEPESFKQRDDQIMGEMEMHTDFILHNWCLTTPCIRKFDTPDLAWMDSGKVTTLVKLLKQYKENGDRVLVFSQFVMVLDVLEAVLDTSLIRYTRIDGSTPVDLRQTRIDQFRDDEEITCFLLSTGAGGQGINLMYANKVIIFDQSFNPQDDVQAENRAHRVGQKREVEVVRLISRGTIEEAMYTLGQSKLALDNKVAGIEDAKAEASFKKLMEQKVLDMLVDGKADVGGEELKVEESKGSDKEESEAELEEPKEDESSAKSSPSQPDVKKLVIERAGSESSELSELDEEDMLL